jgi:hypothetical protein
VLIVLLIGAAVLTSALFAWFFVLESNDRRHTIFNVVAVVFIAEAIVTPEVASVPVGLLRPELFGQDFRPPDLLLVAALAARVLAGRWGRIGPVGLAWSPFFALYFTGVVIGLMVGLEFAQVLFQGKVLLYVLGGLVVASGVDIDRLYDSIGTLGLVLCPLLPIGLVVSLSELEIALNTPLQDFPELGRLSHDSVTILVVIGGAVIITEAVRARPRWYVAAAGFALLLVPITRDQRGSYLTLAAVVGVGRTDRLDRRSTDRSGSNRTGVRNADRDRRRGVRRTRQRGERQRARAVVPGSDRDRPGTAGSRLRSRRRGADHARQQR